jgi:hypothetical protein
VALIFTSTNYRTDVSERIHSREANRPSDWTNSLQDRSISYRMQRQWEINGHEMCDYHDHNHRQVQLGGDQQLWHAERLLVPQLLEMLASQSGNEIGVRAYRHIQHILLQVPEQCQPLPKRFTSRCGIHHLKCLHDGLDGQRVTKGLK